jgi:hypothetical protein
MDTVDPARFVSPNLILMDVGMLEAAEKWGNVTKQEAVVPGGMEAVCLSG